MRATVARLNSEQNAEREGPTGARGWCDRVNYYCTIWASTGVVRLVDSSPHFPDQPPSLVVRATHTKLVAGSFATLALPPWASTTSSTTCRPRPPTPPSFRVTGSHTLSQRFARPLRTPIPVTKISTAAPAFLSTKARPLRASEGSMITAGAEIRLGLIWVSV